MKYIGNFSNWITVELMNHLSSHTGDTMSVWQPDKWKGHPLLDEALERCRPGYAHTSHDFQQFNAKSADMKDFIIKYRKPIVISLGLLVLNLYFGFDARFTIINLLWLLV